MAEADPIVHVTVEFDQVGEVLEYQAPRSAAWAFAASAKARHIARVSIDNLIKESLAPLPCQTLWP
ncbi:hypothetical protein [Nocardia carnea]|uniref:hypothetical protein n=1 Tax=Nocardia carnea TaxID=37328 RepID=UPI002458FAB9|nr:hypothetical protein [Nocardia carnea]